MLYNIVNKTLQEMEWLQNVSTMLYIVYLIEIITAFFGKILPNASPVKNIFVTKRIAKSPFGYYVGMSLWKTKITFYLFPKVFLAHLFIPYGLILK